MGTRQIYGLQEFCTAMDTNANPKYVLVVLFMCLLVKLNIALGANMISTTQSLSGDQTIESERGVFELGFFKPGKSPNYYIGMWYKQVTKQTVVWVANRDKPVSDRFSSELKISDGNLVLFNESKVPIWFTNVNSTRASLLQAVLWDNGNFVLNDGSNLSTPLWQSFDYPTDTWLPGNKIGYNKVTRTKQVLVSWKSSEDPSLGLFSFEMEPSDVSYLTIWNRSKIYWNTGPWTGTFTLAPENRPNIILYFELVSNDKETSFIMHATNSSVISHISMSVNGQMQQHLWRASNGWNLLRTFPRQLCQVYASCGAFGICHENFPFCRCLAGFGPNLQSGWGSENYYGGCLRRTKLQCGNRTLENSESDRFLEMQSVSLPENQQFVGAESLGECKTICLNNCSCIAYAYGSNGCSIWTENLLNSKQLASGDSNGRTLYIRLAASELHSSKSNKGVIIGAVVGSVAGSVLLLCLLFFILRQRKHIGAPKAMEGTLIVFGYRDLQSATKNFAEKLGGGGFGSVFKGTLSDSSIVAVKKLESFVQGEKQFRTEVSTMGTIQHVNLVWLRGFCSKGAKKLLVYDYMPNGSLDSHLFHDNKQSVLDWKTRYKIALGTARGLVYLHEKCRNCIIHCDIKPENILLDADFCPKVADFGLAKLIGREFSRILTTIRGTRGYLAPEWIAGMAITAKADVYSYGMMLFEFVSGRRNSGQYQFDGKLEYFPTLAASVVVEGGYVLGLLDPGLEGNADLEEVERVCKVATWCIQDDEAHRPSMSQVVQMLEGILEVNLPPVPQSLQLLHDTSEDDLFTKSSTKYQSSQALSSVSNLSSQA